MGGRRRNASPSRRAWQMSSVVTCLVLLLALAVPRPAAAAEPGEPERFPLIATQFLEPIKDQLGGSAWVMASGLDPRFAGHAPEGKPLGAEAIALAGGSGGRSNGAISYQQVPFRNPAPAFSRNLIISRAVGLVPISTEPHIAVDPTDPEHLVVGVIDYNTAGLATYTSFDGGETWNGPNQVRYFREDFGAAGDPVVAFDRDGTVYLASISVGFEEFRIGNIVSFAQVSSMAVSKSYDGGLTWSDAVSAARSTIKTVSNVDPSGRERGTVTLQFLDKPWIGVGPSPTDPEKDVLYLSYTEFSTTYSLIYADELPFLTSPVTETTIRVVRSEDGGLSWSTPVAASPTVLAAEGASEPGEGEGGGPVGNALGMRFEPPVQAQDEDGGPSTQETEDPGATEAERTVQGSQPKVLSDGTLVVAYLDTTNDGIQKGLSTIMVSISRDKGRTFEQPVQAGLFREPHFQTRSASFRYWGAAFPQVAIGPNDEIFIATTALPPDKPTDDGDIYLMRSFDGGKTWKEPIRVNQDRTSRTQFFPAVAIGPDGVVHLMWGDMRDDPQEVRYNIYYTKSEDQGETFGFTLPEQNFTAPDTRVSDFPSNSLRAFPGGQFIGDYFAITVSDADVYMVWADSRLGEFGGFAQQIGFARQTAIRAPSLFLNPPSGSAGRVVDIQGLGFQPDSNILLLVSGVIVANPRTNAEGGFTTSIYMPVTGEGPTSVSAFDETGNVATASFYTEFGFDTLQESLSAINQQLGLPNQGSRPSGTPVPAASPAPAPAATPATSGSAPMTVAAMGMPNAGGLPGAAAVFLALAGAGGWLWRRRHA